MRSKYVSILAATTVAMVHFATSANAAISIDVRLASGNPKAATVAVGDTVNLNIYVVLPNVNGNASDDGVQSVRGSLLSSNGGLAVNFTQALAASPFNVSYQDTATTPSAARVDLDGDGDLDVGSNVSTAAAGFLAPRASALQVGAEFLICTAQLAVTSDLLGSTTELNWRNLTLNGTVQGGLWREDNVVKGLSTSLPAANQGSMSVGAPVVLATAVPEPMAFGILPITAALLRRKARR